MNEPSYTIDTAYFCPSSQAKIHLRLGYHLLNSLSLSDLDQSTAVPSLSRDRYNLVLTPVPKPEIQEQLAYLIDELFTDLDDGEALLARACDDLGTWRSSLLKAAITGELTASWRAANPPAETGADLLARILDERHARWLGEQPNKGKRYVEPAVPDLGELPTLPKNWIWTTLEALLENGIQNGLYLPQSAYGGTVPIMRIDDFQAASARASSRLRRVTVDEGIKKAYSLKVGDYIINRVNSMSHLGKSFLVQDEHIPALFESNMMRMRPSQRILASYLETYLASEIGRHRMCRHAKAAVNQASINQRDVGFTPVPLPPRDEQAEITKMLSGASGSHVFAQAAGLSATSIALRQSILRAAFRGDLVA